jgi:hypothetical protein
VAVEVVDGRERQSPCPRERLGCRETDEERSDQARPLGDGDRVDVVEARSGFAERLLDNGCDELEMPARCDLRHDAAEPRVQLRLG